ncbi:response regulator transcription factor [Sediminitomix flava]|uniref:Regulatory LuxR family protein n=1 Tax=Sediminitomix flava TaxID=379075 RepID=A0A315ZF54_SEDFL|nr:LuxR C-terminal-related transcriptional regulator [Sediminitomix flava]PWJ44216.1 regulatory LuxR family protein [Sediminitomix flava]
MDIVKKLERELFEGNLETKTSKEEVLEVIEMVKSFVKIDGALAVISDLTKDVSYIYAGHFGTFLGVKPFELSMLDTIWEDEIFQKIHEDDLFERHLLEYEFLHFLKEIPPSERLNYATKSYLRTNTSKEKVRYITHRTSYLKTTENGQLALVLCLYNFSDDQAPNVGIGGKIMNKITGDKIEVKTYHHSSSLLSPREGEILQHIERGLLSKEIASALNISVHTVNRHRQNILEKLKAGNSMEAVQRAKAMQLIT